MGEESKIFMGPQSGGNEMRGFGKFAINFAKIFAISVYTCYTVWAL